MLAVTKKCFELRISRRHLSSGSNLEDARLGEDIE